MVLGTEYADLGVHPTDRLEIVLVKEGNTWRVYAEGELKAERTSAIAPYSGTLFLCSERDQYGYPCRYSTISLRNLTIVNRALTEEEILLPDRNGKE